MFDLDWIAILGYVASVVILISLLMNSILKLRWINSVGAVAFSAYGFIIGSIPTGIMNLAITIINIYYLYKYYKSKEYFKLLKTQQNDQYLGYFLDFYKEKIKKNFPKFDFSSTDNDVSIYILRNLVTAGIFMGKKIDDKKLLITLDFVTPEYRDFKVGKFLFDNQSEIFSSIGIKELLAYSNDENHTKYLVKMGFVKDKKVNKLFTKKV